jgi:osmotically-inducible protein OsmY
LSGQVADLLAHDRAVRIAQLTRGVTAVQDRLGVEDTGRSDPDIGADLLTAFSNDPATDAWQIGVDVHSGVVTLTGTVQSPAEKNLAAQVVKSVAGVRDIVNELTIDLPEIRSDEKIRVEVEELLRWGARLDGGHIAVEVEDGRVELTGAVAGAYEKALAIRHAWARGVTAVDAGRLAVLGSRHEQIQPRPSLDNLDAGAIAAAVERAMRGDARLTEFELGATVVEGTVFLTGVVDNLLAKRTAGDLARSVVGVERVLNYTKVRPELELTDAEIAAAARAAIGRDPIVSDSGITVRVDDATAKLYGVVDTDFERTRAGTVVAGVQGVVDVANYLATHESLGPTPENRGATRLRR